MINELIKLIQSQEEELQRLLELLETQYKMIMSKDVFGLEGLVDKINESGKKIAKQEIERRNLTGEQNIKDIIYNSNNDKLKELYGKIQTTLNNTIMKKETNEMLLKQQIVFNNKMLEIINPRREMKTYNSYGNLSR
ncbi:flagellar export chaperone FlgN [Clostridium beijerinckii]|uniref:Flagellar biosynthesis/type III secretory pathway chaperone n=1 Tax=Clostridium beijerinckii TaxID=1520 RepID=A0A9Q5CSV5_CLOBE|nr:flagellar export chaperone FlgN [Clostridium beijerinckii]AQS07153.1 FlgN protein [Clostridium beijerinckii]MBA2883649.1 flagellar biosynthesis/type III secretory pathway chaperone [Clostridium beijerinckii]MBA2898836.1 flagellar biosynthesis/type III secretory pathway chaperone [Clostridium beijerinckii]MBA2908236.1 flagellar biosynthesis/type III secretory pathway chaperone [Clostridium beijerinckii]MBA9013215.1 flagellar biosynthesis/type III secretory pathway chaperone [Clostridium beij